MSPTRVMSTPGGLPPTRGVLARRPPPSRDGAGAEQVDLPRQRAGERPVAVRPVRDLFRRSAWESPTPRPLLLGGAEADADVGIEVRLRNAGERARLHHARRRRSEVEVGGDAFADESLEHRVLRTTLATTDVGGHGLGGRLGGEPAVLGRAASSFGRSSVRADGAAGGRPGRARQPRRVQAARKRCRVVISGLPASGA